MNAARALHPKTCLIAMALFSLFAIYFQDMQREGFLLFLVWGLLIVQLRGQFFHAIGWILRYGALMTIFFLMMLLFEPWQLIVGDVLRCLLILSMPSLLRGVSQHELLQALQSLRLPQMLAFMLQIAVSFYPLFLSETRDLWQAVQLRGLALRQLTAAGKLRLYLSLLLPLMGRTLRRARGLAVSLEARGLKAGQQRTVYPSEPLQLRDYIVLLVLVAGCILIWRMGNGFVII